MTDKPSSCIIIDDEPLAIRLLSAHVNQVPQLNLLNSFESPVKALAFLRETNVDLIFLDIQMPTMTGLEFARTIAPTTRVIFTTAYRDYAIESFEFNVVDYILKPITFARFYQAVDKFLRLQISLAPADPAEPAEVSAPKKTAAPSASKAVGVRFINVNKKQVKLVIADILFVESVKDYINIHTEAKTITTREKISDFANSLPDRFLRVHRSFVVNLDKITAFTMHDIEIGDKEIPIGISYRSEVVKCLN